MAGIGSFGQALAGLCALAGMASGAVAQTAPITLETALKEFQLPETRAPIRETLKGWTKPSKLVVVVDRPERTAWLQQAMPAGVKVVGVKNDVEARALISDADAMVQSNCRPENFAGAKKMKWIHAGGAGSDQCLVIDGVPTGDIILTNSQKVKNTSLAEMALGYVFTLSRSLDVGLENQRAQAFGSVQGRRAKPIAGSTMLIVGLGGAGTEIAKLGHGLGMKIIATRNSSREGPDYVSYVGLADELPNLIGQADIVMICAPLTPATRGLFNYAMMQKMKKDAMLINWTRAEIIVKEDLDKALRDGTIGSAALNWATYVPLPKGDSLWTAPNLLLAPWGGSGGGTEGAAPDTPINEMRWLVMRENMRRFATGDKMLSVFDLERGY